MGLCQVPNRLGSAQTNQTRLAQADVGPESGPTSWSKSSAWPGGCNQAGSETVDVWLGVLTEARIRSDLSTPRWHDDHPMGPGASSSESKGIKAISKKPLDGVILPPHIKQVRRKCPVLFSQWNPDCANCATTHLRRLLLFSCTAWLASISIFNVPVGVGKVCSK